MCEIYFLGKIFGEVKEISNFNEHRFKHTELTTPKIVHFVRDPFNLILSTYNYHLRGVEDIFRTKRLKPARMASLDCESNLFYTCLWEKNSLWERLVMMTRVLLYDPAGEINPFVDIESIYRFYETFEKLPNAMNVCLEDFGSDLIRTIEKVSNSIAPNCPTIQAPAEVAEELFQVCKEGICNSFDNRLKELYYNDAYKCSLYEVEESCGRFKDR